MKKTVFLLFTFLAVNISAIAQCNQRPNADHYLLQGNTYLHADEIDLNPFDNNGEISLGSSYFSMAYVATSFASINDDAWQRTTRDYAQMQHSDTLLTIVGVSALLPNHNYGLLEAYLCVADSDFNIYRRVKIPNDSANVDCNYTELFFEQPINVQGDFSIIWENPKPDTIQNSYDHPQTIPYLLLYAISKDTTNCGFYSRVSHPDGTISPWTYIFDDALMMLLSFRYVAYLFPIFGELDTTLPLVGQPEDTILADTSSITRINIVDKYSHIFPNPTKEELNIQCSFRINDIEIYNALGQKIFEKEVKGYNTTIDVANFEKGNYILKINTPSGMANKKFLIQ